MFFTPGAVDMVARINRDALPDLCTVERATMTPTPSGGSVPAWLPVSAALTDLPCRVSPVGTDREALTGSVARRNAEYTVALDYEHVTLAALKIGDRLALRSGPGEHVAYAMTLYVLGFDGPQSLDPFPKILCAMRPQAGG
jgi:hypothetical protein